MPMQIRALIMPEHFAAFRKLMPKEEQLGKTYGEWMARHSDELARPETKQVTVTPDEFQSYCVQLGQLPSYSVLEAFAAKKARDIT